MVTLSQLDLTTVEASASEPNWRKCYIAITRKSEIKQSSTLGLWGLGFPNTQSWFRHADRRERWPRKRSPAPRLLGVPSPPPPTPPKAVRGPSYTVPPPNPLSHATARVTPLAGILRFFPFPSTHQGARSRSSRTAVSLQFSRSVNREHPHPTACTIQIRPLPSATRKKRSSPPLRRRNPRRCGRWERPGAPRLWLRGVLSRRYPPRFTSFCLAPYLGPQSSPDAGSVFLPCGP